MNEFEMKMIIRHCCTWLIVFTGMLLMPATVLAQHDRKHPPEPVYDINGHTEHKIVHRLAPEIYTQSPFSNHTPKLVSKAPTAGPTTSASSPITYNGGFIMPSVSKVVLIWYGNWNQNNGSDTPQGQQIIRDVIYGLSFNSYTNSNYTYSYSGITTGNLF